MWWFHCQSLTAHPPFLVRVVSSFLPSGHSLASAVKQEEEEERVVVVYPLPFPRRKREERERMRERRNYSSRSRTPRRLVVVLVECSNVFVGVCAGQSCAVALQQQASVACAFDFLIQRRFTAAGRKPIIEEENTDSFHHGLFELLKNMKIACSFYPGISITILSLSEKNCKPRLHYSVLQPKQATLMSTHILHSPVTCSHYTALTLWLSTR